MKRMSRLIVSGAAWKTGIVIALFVFAARPACVVAQVRVLSIEAIPGVVGTYPSWSPDGQTIAFERDGDLFTIARDGSGEVRLAPHPALDETPVWSPSGEIVFASERNGELDVFAVRPEGTGLRRLTTHPADDDHPRIAPQGSSIVFNSKRHDGETYQIWMMNLDGSDARRLTFHDDWDTYPSLSRDTHRLLWRRVLMDDGRRNSEIFTMNLNEGHPVNVSRHPGFDGYPVWSPNEAWIAFASDRDSEGADQLFVMRSDGTDVVRLNPLEPGVQYARPSWSPDGSQIVATREEGGETTLVVFTLEGPHMEGLQFSRITTGRLVNDHGQSRGLAWGDYDNDGDADLYVANTGGQWNFFYRNNGDGSFSKRRGVEVVRHRGFSEGVNWVDYDNDGDLDLFVANRRDADADTGDEPNFLFRNAADSGFVRVTEGPLVEDRTYSVMACWADYDNDGHLDAFVVNRGAQNDALYHNLGGGRFERVRAGPLVNNGGEGRACAWGDVDDDGDPDLYVGNMAQRNFFYRNDNGVFVEVREGPFVTQVARTYGVSFADYDDDEAVDLLVANIGRGDRNVLYQNDGAGRFVPTRQNPIVDHVKYEAEGGGASKGQTWGDFDNDGDLDLYVANGTYAPNMRNFLYVNQGAGRFTRILDGPMVADADTSAGVAWADYDNDGDLDLFVANWGSDDQDNALYRNETVEKNWFSVRLEGQRSNRFGIGAKLRLLATIAGRAAWQTRWVFPGTGYGSQNAYDVHIGLGDAPRIDSLEVHWPSGVVDRYAAVAPNRFWIAREADTLSPDERKRR